VSESKLTMVGTSLFVCAANTAFLSATGWAMKPKAPKARTDLSGVAGTECLFAARQFN
jgi:hypothetical protein